MQIDSTFRDRSMWPNPANFEIGFQNKSGSTCDDVVSDMSYSFIWTSHLFDSTAPGPNFTGTLTAFTAIGSATSQKVQSLQYGIELIVTPNNPGGARSIRDYYRGATAVIGTSRRSIFSSDLLAPNVLRLRLQGPPLTTNPAAGDAISIQDSTSASLGLWFVPNGPTKSNAFAQYSLFNETLNQTSPVLSYDGDDCLLKIQATTWSDTDNVGICKTPPEVFTVGFGGNAQYIHLLGNTSTITNFYVGHWLYVTSPQYNDVNPIGEVRQIINYNVGTQLVHVTPPYSVTPPPGTMVLMWYMARDNCVPLYNSGFLSAQKRNVREICYTLSIVHLTLPNVLLNSGTGGKIAQSNFVFVELRTLPLSESNQTFLCTNNSTAAQSAMFCLAIPNITRENSAEFVNIPGGNFKARLQWKPSSLGLAVRIRFANGDIFTTLESDTVQPYSPKPHLQISILLAMENVATGTEERQFLITS